MRATVKMIRPKTHLARMSAIVPAVLSVGAIAGNLYGDASRGGEILSLNAITDPYAVKAGTRLQVYQAA